jgi:hypothetical protein
MSMKLDDTQVIEAVSKAITTEQGKSFDDFVKTLSLPSDEQAAIMEWVQTLPDLDVDPATLPIQPPSVMTHSWWH